MVENAAYALPRHSIPTDILAHISVDLAYSVTECLIDPERLKLGKSVGKGLCPDLLLRILHITDLFADIFADFSIPPYFQKLVNRFVQCTVSYGKN